jgi:hypothetical protein
LGFVGFGVSSAERWVGDKDCQFFFFQGPFLVSTSTWVLVEKLRS